MSDTDKMAELHAANAACQRQTPTWVHPGRYHCRQCLKRDAALAYLLREWVQDDAPEIVEQRG